jgi:hypothetical protein
MKFAWLTILLLFFYVNNQLYPNLFTTQQGKEYTREKTGLAERVLILIHFHFRIPRVTAPLATSNTMSRLLHSLFGLSSGSWIPL